MKVHQTIYIPLLILLLLLYSCSSKPGNDNAVIERTAKIKPDYSDVTIPPNIAPLNFAIKEEGNSFYVKFSSESGDEFEIASKSGKIIIPEKKWQKMMKKNKGKIYKADIYSRGTDGKWFKFKTIRNKIAPETVDPYLYYRLLYPGYESWSELSINSRNLGNYSQESFIENSVADENCVNCHSFNNGKSDDFLFHMRGSMGGTYFYSGGNFKKINLKTKELKNGAVYPRWHPSGKFVAFSSNKIIQRFHAADNKKVEVSDLESSLVLYDVEKNEIMNIKLEGMENYMDTYPEWSPDGTFLYFCRAPLITENYDYKLIRYNIYRVPFAMETRSFGTAELILDATQGMKSAVFPRISPDGKYLVCTVADYGCFPIWHKEADLISVDLSTLKTIQLQLNSDFADSYHSWSSNSRWIVFSSKRDDGRTARPYFSYINENGESGKPFILPQKDPEYYNRFEKSFNIPEFSTIEIKMNPGMIRRLSETKAEDARWYEK